MNDSSVKIHEVLDLAPLRLIWGHLPSPSPPPNPTTHTEFFTLSVSKGSEDVFEYRLRVL